MTDGKFTTERVGLEAERARERERGRRGFSEARGGNLWETIVFRWVVRGDMCSEMRGGAVPTAGFRFCSAAPF